MNKKYSIGAIIILLILIALAFIFLLTKKSSEGCDPYQDINITTRTGDIKGCNCLVDSKQKKQCQDNILAAGTYTGALKESNLSACAGISNLEMKDSCLKIVQGKIDYARTLSTSSIPQQ